MDSFEGRKCLYSEVVMRPANLPIQTEKLKTGSCAWSGQNPLNIALIISKVFKYLPAKDRKSFRLVNKLCRNASLEQWRKSTLFLLGQTRDKLNQGLAAFLDLCEGGKYEAYQIKKFPFRRVCIYKMDLALADLTEEIKRDLKDLSESDKKWIFPMSFWDIVASHLNYLELSFCALHWSSFASGMGWILLEKCPKLEKLVLLESGWDSEKPKYTSFRNYLVYKDNTFPATSYKYFNGKWLKEVTLECSSNLPSVKVTDAVKQCYAENLKSLSFDGEPFPDWEARYPYEILEADVLSFRNLLDMIPNVKNICTTGAFVDGESLLEALRHPTRTTNKIIQLQGLGFTICQQFQGRGGQVLNKPFRFLEYLKSTPKPITDIEIDLGNDLGWDEFRRPPFPFYQLLNLENWIGSLTKLIVRILSWKDLKWFTDFTGHSLPQLRHLALLFFNIRRKSTKFDFGALCGMPRLQKLVFYSIVEDVGGVEKNENELCYKGRQEWMGISDVEDFSTLELSNLEEFQFRMYHNLGNKALRRLGEIMKNLKRLAVVVNPENFEVIQNVWPNLEKLTFLPDHQQFWDTDLSRHNYKNLIHGYTGSLQLALSEQKRVGWRLGEWESSLGGEFSRGVYN